MTLLADTALRATVIFAVAWILTMVLRRSSADLRHRIWLAALAAVALLPIAQRVVPALLPASPLLTLATFVTGAGAANATRTATAFPWLTAIWISGAVLLLLRLAIGFSRISRVTRRAESVEPGIRTSVEISTPLTWGAIRPVILLPKYASEWTAEQRQIVLHHERAHIARRDWLWQTVAQLVAAIFWFHPLVWLAVASLRREAERAADDHVLASGASAPDYAERLLDVARRMSAPAHATAVAMTRATQVEDRVREILDASRRRAPARLFARFAIALGCLAILLPLGAMPPQETKARKAHKIGEDGVTAPKLVSKVEPNYTEEARSAKIEGTVVLQMIVNENGVAEDVTVVRSLDEGLDEQAKIAIRQWKFEPGTKDGEAVPVLAQVEVNFRLL